MIPRLSESDRLRPPAELAASDPWYKPKPAPAARPAEPPRRRQGPPAEVPAGVVALIFEDAFWGYLVAAWEGKAGLTMSPIPSVPD